MDTPILRRNILLCSAEELEQKWAVEYLQLLSSWKPKWGESENTRSLLIGQLRSLLIENKVEREIRYLTHERGYRPQDHPLWMSIGERMLICHSLELDELKQLKIDLYQLSSDYCRRNRIHIEIGPFPFMTDIQKVEKYIDLKAPDWYLQPIISREMKLHGYQLPSDLSSLQVSYDDFLDWEESWNCIEKAPSWEEFWEWFQDNTCTDWCKMDKHGECYGGPWLFPEGSEERENAWNLCQQENARALFDLLLPPISYPYTFLKLTIEIGCRNRNESVLYTISLCEWMRRKLAQRKEKLS